VGSPLVLFESMDDPLFLRSGDNSMGLSRSTGALLGTDESTLVSIANTTTTVGTVTDVLGDSTSVGDIWLYAIITSTVAIGSIDIKFNNHRVGTTTYSKVNFETSIIPINGTQRVPLGKRPASRYMNVEVRNNATGASASVSILYELEKLT
jgi:hypothetical protein